MGGVGKEVEREREREREKQGVRDICWWISIGAASFAFYISF